MSSVPVAKLKCGVTATVSGLEDRFSARWIVTQVTVVALSEFGLRSIPGAVRRGASDEARAEASPAGKGTWRCRRSSCTGRECLTRREAGVG